MHLACKKRGADMPLKRNEHWEWRLHMATVLASQLSGKTYGVVGCYIFGSTKNATCGPASDIDLILHVRNTPQQQHCLKNWLQGWSLCLAEINLQKTGEPSDGLLDVHFVTDADIAAGDSFACKLSAISDRARPLTMKDSV
jgi:predicted nucleotidyltransferase